MELAKNKRGGWREKREKILGRKKIMCKGPAVGKHVAQSSCCKLASVAGTPKGSRAWYEMGLVR